MYAKQSNDDIVEMTKSVRPDKTLLRFPISDPRQGRNILKFSKRRGEVKPEEQEQSTININTSTVLNLKSNIVLLFCVGKAKKQ